MRDYVRTGFRRGLSLNPLVDELVAGRELPEPWRVPALYAYLVSDRATVRLHPWWDDSEFSESASSEPMHGPLERVWAQGSAARLRFAFDTVELLLTLGEFRDVALRAAREWNRGSVPPSSGIDSDDPSILWLVQRQDRHYDERLQTVVELTAEARTLVAFVDADASQWTSFAALQRLVPSVQGVLVPRGRSYGEVVTSLVPSLGRGVLAVVEPAVTLSAEQIRRLWVEAVPGVMVAPVQLRADGTVDALGAAQIGSEGVYRLLAGHPVEDLAAFPATPIGVPMLTGRTFVMTRSDYARAAECQGAPGTDRDIEGLSRAHASRDGSTSVVVLPTVACARFDPDRAFAETTIATRVTHSGPDSTEQAVRVLERAGFRVLEWQPTLAGPRPRLEWVRPRRSTLRWAIKICAPAGPRGDVWGDRHFAHGLASALRRAGHFAAIDAFDAKDRATNYLDDVTVVVRGPYRIDPPRQGVRIEWIISHPDEITDDEVARFDRVFAASERWARKVSQRGRYRVEALLECTDTDLFHPRGLPRGEDIVFVGTARGIARPSVVTPLAAGIPVKVYGPDWRTFIDPAAIEATSIPNRELAARYETASIVLNDQWPAMKREGFMAMRPFDAVAAGGRVISEEVDGIEEIFGGAVVTYRDEAHLVELLRRDPGELFPDASTLAKISEEVRLHHSFDARARVLIRAAHEQLQQRPGLHTGVTNEETS
ncbi:MAG: hypothetical protein KDB08_00735 [Microthrixaceae bacterium]|nr:hypothetical protein [Microthrixaceae bacterium]